MFCHTHCSALWFCFQILPSPWVDSEINLWGHDPCVLLKRESRMETSRVLWYETNLYFRPVCSYTGLHQEMCCLISGLPAKMFGKCCPNSIGLSPFVYVIATWELPFCLSLHGCLLSTSNFELKYCLLIRCSPASRKAVSTWPCEKS